MSKNMKGMQMLPKIEFDGGFRTTQHNFTHSKKGLVTILILQHFNQEVMLC